MKKKIVLTAVAVAGAVAFIPGCASRYDQQARTETINQPWFVEAQPPQSQRQAMQQRQFQGQQLISFDEIEEMRIENARGEDLGKIDKLMVDTQREKIAYAVVSTSGAWNLGGEKAIVPWNALHIQPRGDRGEQVLVLDMPQQRLMNAPRGEIGNALDPEQARQIHDFYGVAPYWTER